MYVLDTESKRMEKSHLQRNLLSKDESSQQGQKDSQTYQ